MKTINAIFKSLSVGIILILSANLYAQDPIKVASNVYKKVILDNEKVRVIQVEFAPGAIAVWHWHPAHVVYALSDGTIEITNKGEEPKKMDIMEGTAMFMPSVTHMAKNVGNTTLKLLVTELKPMKMMHHENKMKAETSEMNMK